jgi:hypothetical protein
LVRGRRPTGSISCRRCCRRSSTCLAPR